MPQVLSPLLKSRGSSLGTLSLQARVQTVRLENEEQAFRAIPLVGSMEDATPKAIRLAPVATAEGPYAAFKSSGQVGPPQRAGPDRLPETDGALLNRVASKFGGTLWD